MIYIDDLLLLAQSAKELLALVQEVLTLFELLGFVVNLVKSLLTPRQKVSFLGFLIDSQKMRLYLPEEKKGKIVAECQGALQQAAISVRSLAKMIGRMSAASQAILPAPLY